MFSIKNHDDLPAHCLRSARQQIFFLLLCAVFIPLLLFTTFIVLVNTRNVNALNQQTFEDYFNSVYSAVETHLSPIRSTITLLEDSEPIRRHMKQTASATVSSDPAPIENILRFPHSYKEAFQHRAVSAVTVFSQKGMEYYALAGDMDLGLQRCQQIFDQYKEGEFPDGEFVWTGGSSYAYWIQDYRNIYENLYYGKIVIEFYPIPTNEYDGRGSSASSYWIDTSRYDGMQYYISDEKNTIIFARTAELSGKALKNVLPDDVLTQEGSTTFDILQKQLPVYGVTLTVVIPHAILAAQNSFLSGLPPLAVFLGLLLYFGILFLLFRQFVEPITRLHDYYLAAQSYPLTVPSLQPHCLELEELLTVLRDRIDDIEALKKHHTACELKIKEAEIKSLQAQMDPHFLFNILDSIGWKAAESGSSDVSTMVQRLGEMLRSDLMFNDRQKLTLREELQYVQNYLILQKIRSGAEAFDYTINADDEILGLYYLPKLTLQPIVENCITHAFRGINRKGHIQINIWEDMDAVYCHIIDNGCGFDSDRYFDQPATEAPSNHGNHIALSNIQNRLRMLYGPEYGLTIKSVIDEGTTVIVRLPFDRNKDS